MSGPTVSALPAPTRPSGRAGAPDRAASRTGSGAADFAAALDRAGTAQDRDRYPTGGREATASRPSAAADATPRRPPHTADRPDRPRPPDHRGPAGDTEPGSVRRSRSARGQDAPVDSRSVDGRSVDSRSVDSRSVEGGAAEGGAVEGGTVEGAGPTGEVLPAPASAVAPMVAPTPPPAPVSPQADGQVPAAGAPGAGADVPTTGPGSPAEALAGQGGAEAGGRETGRGFPAPEGTTPVATGAITENTSAATAPEVAVVPRAAPVVGPEAAGTAAATTAPADGASVAGGPAPVRTLEGGPVPAPAQVSRPPVVPDLATQLVPRVGSLRSLGEGVHRLVLRVQPEQIGAVRVVAEITADSVRIELHGGTEQAREALRAALPDLRRDLQGGDLPGHRAELDLGSAGRHGQQHGADRGSRTHRDAAVPTVLDDLAPVELVLGRVPAGRLDVVT